MLISWGGLTTACTRPRTRCLLNSCNGPSRRVMPGVRQLSHSEGSMLAYTEAKQFLIENLTRDTVAHESGRYRDIGSGFDELDANLPRDSGPEFEQLFIALAFWDGWIDARNHD